MSKQSTLRRLLAVVLTLAMLVSLPLTAFATNEQETETAQKAAAPTEDMPTALPESGRTFVPKEEADPDEIVRVSIVLEAPSALANGYSTKGIAKNNGVKAYRTKLLAEQNALTTRIEKEVLDGKKLDVVWNLTLAANLISANVRRGDMEAIAALDGVASVEEECRYEVDKVSTGGTLEPNMAIAGTMNGTQTVWESGYTGAGRLIAIVDTGIDLEHQSFNGAAFDHAIEELQKDGQTVDLVTKDEIASALADEDLLLNCKTTNPTTEDLYRSSKIPFGYNYVDKSTRVDHDDAEGEHGSHVAGIAAANRYIQTENGFEEALDTVLVAGNAPDAQLMVMKVFGTRGGAYDADCVAAIEDAILLGADAVNLSLGSAMAGFSTPSNAYAEIQDILLKSDTVVSVSAGNSGAWADNTPNGALYSDDVNFQTGGSSGSYRNSFTIASVENNGLISPTVEVNGKKYSYNETIAANASIATLDTEATNEYDFVFINGYGAEASEFANAKGKIALIWRGNGVNFSLKHSNAQAAGAIALLVVNNEPGSINMVLEDATIPCVSISLDAGKEIWAGANGGELVIGAGNSVTGKIKVNSEITANQVNAPYLTMSDYSSWGVAGDLTLKPEITAPGGNIYSVWGANSGSESAQEAHDAYELMSGTSMAAPQVTGMAALVQQYLDDPENGLTLPKDMTRRALTQALLMSTAEPLKDADGNFYSVMQQGAGMANVAAAVSTPLLLTVKGMADGKAKVELGDQPEKTGKFSYTLNAANLSAEPIAYTLNTDLFTQAIEEGFLLGSTTPLTANITYKIGDKTITPADVSFTADVNKDGATDYVDAQAVLDYIVGNLEQSKIDTAAADVDGDKKITSHDAYLILNKLQLASVTIPANSSVEIEVSIEITSKLDAYVNGAYIEGFTFLNPLATAEGALTATLSVPVFGFYGNWSDASMFDHGTGEEWYYGEFADKDPYFVDELSGKTTNVLVANNAMVFDGDGVNNGSTIDVYAASVIRSAGDGVVIITNQDGDELFRSENLGQIDAAFFSSSSSAWMYTQEEFRVGWKVSGVEEGDELTVTLILAPEYYARYNYDWDALTDGKPENGELGKGAFLTTKLVVDSEPPEFVGTPEVTNVDGAYTITAKVKDNLSIRKIELYGETNENLVYAYGPGNYTADLHLNFEPTEPDAVYTAKFDGIYTPNAMYQALLGVNVWENRTNLTNDVYRIEVTDIAGNTATERVFVGLEATDTPTAITLSATEKELLVGNTLTLTADVKPVNLNDRSVTWSSDNKEVADVDQNGVVTALKAGEAHITATTNASGDSGKLTAQCTIKVTNLKMSADGILADDEGYPHLFNWNFETGTLDPAKEQVEAYPANAAKIDDNNFYLFDSSGNMYKMNRADGKAVDGPWTWDAANSPVPWAMSATPDGKLHWTYGYYLMVEDSASNPSYMGFDLSDNYGNIYLFGCAAVAGEWSMPLQGKTYTGNLMLYAIDDSNRVWEFYIYHEGANTGALIGYSDSDLTAEVAGYQEDTLGFMPYSNLTVGDDKNLYYSMMTGTTSEVYRLVYNETDDIWESTKVDEAGDNVWPAYLFEVKENGATGSSVHTPKVMEKIDAQTFDASEIEKLSMNKSDEVNGGVNALRGTAYTAKRTTATENPAIDTEANTITVTIRAEDTTNAKAELSYDTALLTLDSLTGKTDFFAANDATEGKIDIAFAADAALNAPVAEAVFHYDEEKELDLKTALKLTTTEDGESVDAEPVVEDIPIDLHQHKLEAVAAKAPTCTEDGNIAYWFCPDCGKYFSDAEATTEITKDATVLKAFDCPTKDYTDNPKDKWYHDYVDYMVANKYILGTAANTFEPDGKLTRGQLVTILYRMAGSPKVTGKTKFTDVPDGRFYSDPVLWAEQNGVVNGMTETTFEPDRNISREQIATILFRYVKAEAVKEDHLSTFKDGASVSNFAKEAMNWAVSVGLFNGDHGNLNPKNDATRAEISAILYRYLNNN